MKAGTGMGRSRSISVFHWPLEKKHCKWQRSLSRGAGMFEGVNGVNRLATNGKKHYRLPTKREKHYRLPTGKLLTDYRHGLTLSIFFSERRVYCIFSTFLGSNQRYHVKYIQIYHKTRILKSVCRAYAKNFYNPPSPTHYMRQMLRLILKENSFQFNGKLYLQTHRTAMGTKTAVSSANIFMSYIETQSLSS